MTTFSIELPDDQAQRLREMAVGAGVTREELLSTGVSDWLDGPHKRFR